MAGPPLGKALIRPSGPKKPKLSMNCYVTANMHKNKTMKLTAE